MLSTLKSISDEWIAVKKNAQQVNAVQPVLKGLMAAEQATTAFVDAVLSKQSYFNQAIGSAIKSQITSTQSKVVSTYRSPF